MLAIHAVAVCRPLGQRSPDESIQVLPGVFQAFNRTRPVALPGRLEKHAGIRSRRNSMSGFLPAIQSAFLPRHASPVHRAELFVTSSMPARHRDKASRRSDHLHSRQDVFRPPHPSCLEQQRRCSIPLWPDFPETSSPLLLTSFPFNSKAHRPGNGTRHRINQKKHLSFLHCITQNNP